MASFNCLSLFEPGSIGSDPGTVIIPSIESPFPMTSMSVGSGAFEFAGAGDYEERSIGSGAMSFAAAGVSEIASAGLGAMTFDAAAVYEPDSPGTLAYRSSDLTAQDYSSGTPVISWDSYEYDRNSVHDESGSPSKFIIPAGLDGHYGIISAKVVLSSAAGAGYSAILKGGTRDFVGRGGEARVATNAEGTSNLVWMQTQTQPILLATGDEFEANVSNTDTSVTLESEKSSFSLRTFSTLAGCLVTKSADQTAVNLSGFPNLTFNTDVYDADAAHDTGSNTDRITIPSAWNGKYGIFRGNVQLSSVSNGAEAAMYVAKAGTSVWDGMGASLMDVSNFGIGWIEAESQPVPLATGEIYTLQGYCSDTSVTIESDSTFGVQVLDTIEGCLCRKTSDQTTANYSTPTAVAWTGTDIYDTDAIHDPSSNNTKLIVPAGLAGKYAIIRCQISAALVTTDSQISLKITKNGLSEYLGVGQEARTNGAATSPRIQCATQPILLETGDEFEAVLYCTDTSITITASSSTFGLYTIT